MKSEYKYEEKLKSMLLFRGLSDSELRRSLELLNGSVRQYQKGEMVLNAGDRIPAFGIVLSGSVTVESNDLWGSCTVLSHVEQGGIFAEVYALLDVSLPVDVNANEDCQILFLRAAALRVPKGEDHCLSQLTANLLQISLRKNLILSGRSFHTAPKTIRGKVLSYLNSVSLQQRSDEFDIPFDRQQLADYLNTDRSALSKELGKMKKDGIIRCRRNHFQLLNEK